MISCFSRKNFIWRWSQLSQVRVTIKSLNSQDMISFMITSESINSHDMIRILKQLEHNFSGKHLSYGYCIDIIWCSLKEVKIQQRALWFCNTSLRTYCVTLFECKVPWILKTDSLILIKKIFNISQQNCGANMVSKYRRLPAQ